jgi:hypothetical protein
MGCKINSYRYYQFVCSKCKHQHTVRGSHINEWLAKHHHTKDLSYYYNNNLCHSCSMNSFNRTKRSISNITRFDKYQVTCSKCKQQRTITGRVIHNWLNNHHKQFLTDYHNENLCHKCLFEEVQNRPDVKAKMKEIGARLETKTKRSKAQKEAQNKPETKTKIKETMARPEYKVKVSGENNCRWLGGVSFEPYSLEFNETLKEHIRKRDNRTCQLCGIPERECFIKLPIHHIDYNKKHSNQDNLISLCKSCHAKTNNNREYWTIKFHKMLEEKQKVLCL